VNMGYQRKESGTNRTPKWFLFDNQIDSADSPTLEPKNKQLAQSRYRILIVEDVPMIQLMELHSIQSLNYEVDIASNGKQAIEKLSSQHDLVLLDIGLPDISGIEVCKQIRKLPKPLCSVPVIVLTAGGESFRQTCLDAGANDFYIKPSSVRNIISKFINELEGK